MSPAISQAFYECIVMKSGYPRTILTNNGTQYTGILFKELLQEMGIVHWLTPAYTPQANPIECTNKTIKTGRFSFSDTSSSICFLPEDSLQVTSKFYTIFYCKKLHIYLLSMQMKSRAKNSFKIYCLVLCNISFRPRTAIQNQLQENNRESN